MRSHGRPRQQVDVFGMQDRRKQGKAKPWIVRWRVEGQQRTKAFRTRAEGDRYRADLLRAIDIGERFDEGSGEPVSWQRDPQAELTVYEWARQWLADQWPEWQPRTRLSAIDALSRFVALAIREDACRTPAGLRVHLRRSLVPETSTDAGDRCEAWIVRNSLRPRDLDKHLLAGVDEGSGWV